jgi:hypothetical protein
MNRDLFDTVCFGLDNIYPRGNLQEYMKYPRAVLPPSSVVWVTSQSYFGITGSGASSALIACRPCVMKCTRKCISNARMDEKLGAAPHSHRPSP